MSPICYTNRLHYPLPMINTAHYQLSPSSTLMKTTIQKFFAPATAAIAMSMSLISTTWAQGQFAGPSPTTTGLPDVAGADGFRTIIVDFLNAILNFLALIAVVIIVIAGIRLILSQGEDEQKDKAKKTILYAIVGLVVVLFARVIVSLVTVYLANQVAP